MDTVIRLAAAGRRKGFITEEERSSLPKLSPFAETLMDAAETRWAAERRSQRPRLWRVVWASASRPFLMAFFALMIRGSMNAFSLPLLLKRIVDALIQVDLPGVGLYLGLLLLERVLGMALEYFGARLMSSTVPACCITTLSGLVLQKAATPGVRGAQQAAVDPGAIVGRELNMMYTRLGMFCPRGFVAMPTLLAGSVTLVLLLGWSSLIGVAWVLLCVRAGFTLQGKAKKAEERMSSVATERLTILNNIVAAIKAIKYFAWEPEFLELLLETRQRECAALRRRSLLASLATTLGKTTPVTGSMVTFVAFALLGNELSASSIFAANSVFMTMRFAVGSSGILLEIYKSWQLVLSRTERFLLLPELPPREILPEEAWPTLAATEDLNISFVEAEMEKSEKVPGEKKISFELRFPGKQVLAESGRLTAICGAVGSGKSTLLQSLLGALEGESTATGSAKAVKSVGWCPQKAFLISGTIRENVLMGRPEDPERLSQCLADACWGRDLGLLKLGLDEVVGERGVTLSGGQQARLSLARALYGDPALLLLDDPLAAVDAAVGRALLRAIRLRCQRPSETGQPPAVVMVLNQVHLLPNFDEVLLVQGGLVTACGSAAKLQALAESKALLNGIQLQAISLADEADAAADVEEMDRVLTAVRGKLPIDPSDADLGFIKQETAAVGLVRWEILREYLMAPGCGFLTVNLLLFVITYAALGVRDWWLTVWANAGGGEQGKLDMGIFILLGLLNVVLSIFCVFMISSFADLAGQHLHSDCISKLMRAPMGYFDETPSGRITSRFGSDLAQMDGMMSQQLDFTMTFGFTFLMMCATVAAKVPWMLLIFGVAAVVSIPVLHGLTLFQQDIKRHANNAMAPVLSNLAEAQRGATLAFAIGCQSFFLARHQALVDQWTTLADASLLTTAVAESWCHFLHLFVLAGTGLLSISNARSLSQNGGLVAMYFSYASLWGVFAMTTMGVVLGLLTNLTSLERLLEYKLGDLPQEPPWHLTDDPAAGTWPAAGAVHFQQVCLRYRPGLPLALDHFELSLRAGEKLGVVGRTGAGKSSITSVLFRLVDCESGSVLIDGVNIAAVGIHRLRKAISMIPQEPIVMNGTVRYNLDPFSRHSEEATQAALATAGLAPGVTLDTVAGGSGAGLSAGQKQLLTLSRTLLQGSRVVVMDEPTASVDMQTDQLVQAAVRRTFADCTVITIAHRLETVQDCDRLAVMDAGQLVELGPPHQLLADGNSRLRRLVKASGMSVSPSLKDPDPDELLSGRVVDSKCHAVVPAKELLAVSDDPSRTAL